jgi:Tol biopolymer transport system component
LVPEIFAPGIISSDRTEHSSPVFSPDGKEVFLSPQVESGPGLLIEFMKYEYNVWTTPQTAPFSGQHTEAHPFFSPDGERLYFYSRRPELWGIWYVERTENGWSEPIPLDIPLPPIGGLSWQHSISADGTLYISIQKPPDHDTEDIYRVELENDQYTQPVRLSNQINSIDYQDTDPCVAPDESYLIFSSKRPGGYGQSDLYISFKKQDGTWSKTKNMGYLVNSYAYDWGPAVSPDGLFLFFISHRHRTTTYTGLMQKLLRC